MAHSRERLPIYLDRWIWMDGQLGMGQRREQCWERERARGERKRGCSPPHEHHGGQAECSHPGPCGHITNLEPREVNGPAQVVGRNLRRRSRLPGCPFQSCPVPRSEARVARALVCPRCSRCSYGGPEPLGTSVQVNPDT